MRSQNAKKVCRHHPQLYLLGFAFARQSTALRPDSAQVFKQPATFADGHQFRPGGRSAPFVAIDGPDDGQPIGFGKRQLFEQHGMNDGEDGRIGADAQGQSGNRHESESRTLEEHAPGEANILSTAVDPHQAAPIAVQFFGLFDAAEFAPRRMTRFCWIHTPANVFIGDQVQVRLQFAVQLLFEMLLAEHIPQSQQ